MTVAVPPQGLRHQEYISPAEHEELVMAYIKAPYGTKKAAAAAARVNLVWIRNWRAAPSDAELYCERHYLAVILDLFEVRLPSYRLPWAASSPTSARCHPSNFTSPRQAYCSSSGSSLRHVRLSS